MRIDQEALNRWVDQPLGEAERKRIAAQAEANTLIHRFDCLCPSCCAPRRALVTPGARAQGHLICDTEDRPIQTPDFLDWSGKVFAIGVIAIPIALGIALAIAGGR